MVNIRVLTGRDDNVWRGSLLTGRGGDVLCWKIFSGREETRKGKAALTVRDGDISWF